MDIIKAVRTRREYDQLIETKRRGFEKSNKIKKKKSLQSGSKSCLWTCLLSCMCLPCTAIKHAFNCACLNQVDMAKRELIKSVIGFLVGLILGWIYFWFLDSVLDTSRQFTIISSVFVLFLLSFGLAFSRFVRIMVLISIPTICSSSGRTILIMIIFVKVFNGPVVNTAYNLHQVGSSISCGSDVIKGDSNKTLSEILSEKSKEIFNRVMEPVKKYNEKVILTITAMTAASASLINKVKKIKALYDKFNFRCAKIAKKIKIKCDLVGKRNWFKGSICWIMDTFGALDKLDKIRLERFCSPYTLIAKNMAKYVLMSTMVKTLNDLKNDIYFDINPNFNYTYNYNESISSRQVLINVKNDLKPLFRWMIILVSVITFLSPLASVLILIRSHFYRSKYLSIDHYDNIYTTSYVYDIDRKRDQTNQELINRKSSAKSGIGRIPSFEAGNTNQDNKLETIFPLSKSEKKRFIEPTSLSWSAFESRRFIISFTFFLFTLFIVITYILLDYVLYWSLDLVAGLKGNVDINYNQEEVGGAVAIDIRGEGDLADVYKNINNVTSELSEGTSNKTTKLWTCWPEPSIPDYDTYRLIQTLLIVCLITIIIESYTLRLRHIFCDYYYPERARVRAVWLYNQIIQSRSSFMRTVYNYFHNSKQIRNNYQNLNEVSLADRIVVCCPCIRWLKDVTGHKNVYCTNCGIRGKVINERENYKKCESTPDCPGIFCTKCLVAIENVCTICSCPVTLINYDDGDESEEVDSSEDESDDTFDDNNLDFDDILTRNKLQKLTRNYLRFGDRDQKVNDDYQLINQDDDDSYDGVGEEEADEVHGRIREETGIEPEEMKRMINNARGMI